MENILKTLPFPSFTPFARPFYTFYKHIFEQSSLPVQVRLLHLLECTALLLLFLRLASLAILLHYGCPLFWDPIGQYFASQLHLYDRYMLICAFGLIIYTFTANWQLFLGQKGTNTITWQSVAYDLTVRNLHQAQRCRRRPPKRSSLQLNQTVSKYRLLRLLFHTIKRNLLQEQLDLDKLQHPRHQLTIFPFLSVNNRKKLLQFDFFANCIATLVPCLISLPFLLGVTLHLLLGVQATHQIWSFPGLLLLLSDLTLLWIMGYLIIRNALLLIYFSTTIPFAIRWHLQAAHRLLRYLMVKYHSRTFQGLNTWNRLLLGNILLEHTQMCTLLDASNQQFISMAVFSAFLLNAPTNIYLIYRLVYRQILLTEITAILCLTFGQSLFLAGSVIPLALVNGAIYQTGKYLPGVQLSVLRGERCRPLKFKYEILQSTLTESRVKSGASFGPVCLITFESLYKVVTLYAVYMLVFFDLLPK